MQHQSIVDAAHAMACAAAQRTAYLRRDVDADRAAYIVMNGIIAERVRNNEWVRQDFGPRVSFFLRAAQSRAIAEWSHIVVFDSSAARAADADADADASVPEARLLVVERELAIDLWFRLVAATTRHSRMPVPWTLLRASSSTYRAPSTRVFAAMDRILDITACDRWMTRLFDEPAYALAAHYARALARRIGPGAKRSAAQAALAPMHYFRDVVRQGAQWVPPGVPVAERDERVTRALFVVRAMCFYALATAAHTDVPSPSSEAATGAEWMKVGRQAASYRLDDALQATERSLAIEPSPTAVQRLFETVVFVERETREATAEERAAVVAATREAVMVPPLFEALVEWLRALAVSRYEGDLDGVAFALGDAMRACATMSQFGAATNDVIMAETLVERLFDIVSIVRYTHVFPLRRSPQRRLMHARAVHGVEVAQHLADRFAMPLQSAALRRLASTTRPTMTVVPLFDSLEAAATPPTVLELSATIRDAVPDARDGRDFVVVWSPDDPQTFAVAMTAAIYCQWAYSLTSTTLALRPPVAENGGDALARTLAAFTANREALWPAAAGALNTLARIFEFSRIGSAQFESLDEVERAVARIEHVTRLLAKNVDDLVARLLDMMRGRATPLLWIFETLLTPRASDVFLCVEPTDTAETAPPWLDGEAPAELLRLWRAFFVHEVASTNVSTQFIADLIRDHNARLGRSCVHSLGSDSDDDDDDDADVEVDDEAPTSASVASRLETFDATSIEHSSAVPRATTMRAACYAEVMRRRGRLHLELIDAILARAPAKAAWVRNVRVFSTPMRRNTALLCRVPTIPKPPMTMRASAVYCPPTSDFVDGAADRDVKVRAALAAHDVSLSTLMRALTAVQYAYVSLSTTTSGVRWSDAQIDMFVRAHVHRVLGVANGNAEPTLGNELVAISPAHVAGTRDDTHRDVDRLIVDGLPRPLAFAHDCCVEGPLTNYYYYAAVEPVARRHS